MKKIISVLMVLGFVWMFAIPNLVGQEQEKEFKSEFDNIKDPKEVRWILIGSYNATAMLATGCAENLMEYAENGKLAQWFLGGHFAGEELIQLASAIEKAIDHVWAAAKLLKLKDADKGIPTMVWQSGKENKTYQGTLEDVRKAEEHIFNADQLLNKFSDSPVLELINKDEEEKLKEELKKIRKELKK